MVDFIKSFDTGLNAAEEAQRNKIEIESVFDALNEQLAKHTNGKIKIAIREFTKANLFTIAKDPFKPRETYFSITASNPTIGSSSPIKLANWEENRAGYPCKIDLFNDEIYCEDKEALEEGLSSLLEDPAIGDIFYSLINLEPLTTSIDDSHEDSTAGD